MLPTSLVQDRRSLGEGSMPVREPDPRLAQFGVGLANRTNVELLPQLDDQEFDGRLVLTSGDQIVKFAVSLLSVDNPL